MSKLSRHAVAVAILLIVCMGVLATAIGLRAYQLGKDCFDGDELYAVRIHGLSPKAVASVMARDGFHTNHPPLMTVPFLFWEAVFGTSEVGVRSLPLVAGVVAVGALLGMGWALGRPWAGVFGAFLLAINPLHITYSAEARQYSLVTALLATANLLFIQALRRGSRGLLLSYYVVAAWAALSHYFAVPVLIGHGAATLWIVRKPGRTRVPALRLLLAVALAGLPYLAWLPVMQFQSKGKWDHLSTLTPGTFSDSLPDLFGVGGWGGTLGLAISCALIALAVYGLWVARSVQLNVATLRGRLVPRWLGWGLVGCGVFACIAYYHLFPRFIEPMGRQTLSGYAYDSGSVDEEITLLRQTGILAAGCIILAGGMIAAWGWIESRFLAASGHELLGEGPIESPPAAISAGSVLTFFFFVPIVVITLGTLSKIPFHQTRNLLVMLPVVCLLWGLALERVSLALPGAALSVVLLAGMAVTVGQYHVVARVVARDGARLGIDTIDWRSVQAWLLANAPSASVIVLVNRPTTDPGLYYLADFRPTRIPPDKDPPNPSGQILFIHLVGDRFSENTKARLLKDARPFTKVGQGDGWEIYSISRQQ